MADWLAGSQGEAGRVQGPWLPADGTESAAVGARLLLVEGLGLLLQEGGKGALGQARRRGAGHLLHSIEIDVQARALVAEGTTGDDFAPTGGEGLDLLEEFGREGPTGHGESCLVLAERGRKKILAPL
jgi:hypothetical protein